MPLETATAAPAPSHSQGRGEPQLSHSELLKLLAYFSLLVIASDVLNVRLGVELMTVSVVLAGFLISRKGLLLVRDWWFFLLGLLLWNLSGPIAAHSPFPPHLDFMLRSDRLLFLGNDPVAVIQHHLARRGSVGPLDVLSAAAYNLHLPEPYIAGYFLWRLNRAIYFQFATAVLILLVAGFVTFFLLPAIPPWMASKQYGRLPGVFNGFGVVLRWHPLPFHGTPIFQLLRLQGDAVAAFPSEHAALPLLEYLAFAVISRPLARLFLIWTAIVLFAVVYLGEHWVTDVIAGWLYALIIFWFVRSFATQIGERQRRFSLIGE